MSLPASAGAGGKPSQAGPGQYCSLARRGPVGSPNSVYRAQPRMARTGMPRSGNAFSSNSGSTSGRHSTKPSSMASASVILPILASMPRVPLDPLVAERAQRRVPVEVPGGGRSDVLDEVAQLQLVDPLLRQAGDAGARAEQGAGDRAGEGAAAGVVDGPQQRLLRVVLEAGQRGEVASEDRERRLAVADQLGYPQVGQPVLTEERHRLGDHVLARRPLRTLLVLVVR